MIGKIIKGAMGVLLVSIPLMAMTPKYTNSEINNKPNVETEQNSGRVELQKLPSLPNDLMSAGGCESNHSATAKPRQFKADGTVVRHLNPNGTIDYGAFQLNSIHIPEAKRLGLDIIHSERDNYLFALMLYKRGGIGQWYGYNSKTGQCSYDYK